MLLHIKILQKFRVEPILVASEDGALRVFFRAFWLKSEILENPEVIKQKPLNFEKITRATRKLIQNELFSTALRDIYRKTHECSMEVMWHKR